MPIRAVIWDFDGTILDTEWPAFEAASREYRRLGLDLSVDDWQETIGTADHEPWWEDLRRQAGGLGDDEDVMLKRYRTLKNEMTDAAVLLPGVQDTFTRSDALGLRSALASSSPVTWVQRHTTRHGLWNRFCAVATRTDVGQSRTKPEPDLFLLAAERAGLEPSECLVIEDSRHGITAARSAGMSTIAVPNRLTCGQDFAHADVVLDSLENLDLEGMVRAFDQGAGEGCI